MSLMHRCLRNKKCHNAKVNAQNNHTYFFEEMLFELVKVQRDICVWATKYETKSKNKN